jgi:pyrroline-5-carboxylate reductase
MAGVTTRRLEKLLQTNQIIRTMPNTPCLVGVGAIAVSQNPCVSAELRDTIAQLLGSVGEVTLVDESHLDAVTGLSGSGPAFVLEFIESLTDGGVLAGLSRDVAARLALQTVYGTACLLQQSQLHPAQLKDQVTSPGGTTIHGLFQLHSHAFRGAVAEAVMSAAERSQELGKHG